jgi:hypothetical protein
MRCFFDEGLNRHFNQVVFPAAGMPVVMSRTRDFSSLRNCGGTSDAHFRQRTCGLGPLARSNVG